MDRLPAIPRLLVGPLLLAVLLLALPLSPGARADQNDASLTLLFEQLSEAIDPNEAMPIEREIWRVWLKHPDRAVNILMKKGIAAMNRQDYRKALEIFDQMVKIAPDYAEAWNKRATVHYLMSQFEESLADINKTLELEPRHFGALAGRGLVYAGMHDLPRALKAFEDALAVNPQMIGPRINAEAIRKELENQEI
jgi:tetratricopeptide (TPR) repeat protein